MFEDERLLTWERFVMVVHESLESVGVVLLDYCGHSFQIGAATMAAERGVQDSLIRMFRRWESSAYLLYIRTPKDAICAVARTLLGDRHAANLLAIVSMGELATSPINKLNSYICMHRH